MIVEVDATCDVGASAHRRAQPRMHSAPRKRGSHRGLGLELVRERLRAAFGAAAGLQTELTDDGTFQARLTFPRREVPAAA